MPVQRRQIDYEWEHLLKKLKNRAPSLYEINKTLANPLALHGAADHWNHREDADYYSQPGALFRLMTPAEQQVLFENTARSLGDAPRAIQIRHISNCLKADTAYGKGIAEALDIPLSEVPK